MHPKQAIREAEEYYIRLYRREGTQDEVVNCAAAILNASREFPHFEAATAQIREALKTWKKGGQ